MNPTPSDDTVVFHALGFSVTRSQLGGYVRAIGAAVIGYLVNRGTITATEGSAALAAVIAWSHQTNAPATPAKPPTA